MRAFSGRFVEIAMAPPSAKEQLQRGEAYTVSSNGQDKATAVVDPPRTSPSLAEVQAKLKKVGVKELDESQLAVAAIRGMLQALPDAEFNMYYTPEEFQAFSWQSQGSRVGIGAWFLPEGKLRVLSPMPGSPALKAGLRAGDLVLSIEGLARGDHPRSG